MYQLHLKQKYKKQNNNNNNSNNNNKNCWPLFNFKGYDIESILSEIRLSQDKLDTCTEVISSLLEGSKSTLLKLQSVIGLLNFTCAFVVPGRAFLRRLTDLMVWVRKPRYHIHIAGEVKQDLHVWLNFLSTYNGKSMFFSELFLDPDVLQI